MIPLAPSMLRSRSGLEIACLAASAARFSPVPTPMPISASPWSLIMVLTSAKSRLITPGTVIKSEMPWIPWRRTSSASLNASFTEVFLSIMPRSLSFGTTRMASTFCFSFSIPLAAFFARTLPSIENGLVTTATVRAPSSFAHCATTGAAPVPVPPPIPAVTNTMSAPLSALVISSRDSSAAFSPTSGLAPAPRPLVSFSPIWILVSAWDLSRTWTSVFTAINSTPCTLASIIRLTALFPPPPTPITLISAKSLIFAPPSRFLFYRNEFRWTYHSTFSFILQYFV